MAPSIKFEEPSTIQALGGLQETRVRFSPTALSVTKKIRRTVFENSTNRD